MPPQSHANQPGTEIDERVYGVAGRQAGSKCVRACGEWFLERPIYLSIERRPIEQSLF